MIFIEMLIGLATGIAVGVGFVAVLTMLGIIPRLIQLSRSFESIKLYTGATVFGAILGTYLSFTEIVLSFPKVVLVGWGLFHGLFIGMLAAALTEVLNVFPIFIKRIGLYEYVLLFIMAIVFGKIFGSLFQWLIFVRVNF